MAIKIRIVSDFDTKGISQADRALDNLAKNATKALAAVGVAMAVVAAKSIQEFAKFDAAMVKSQAIMGDLTHGSMKEMEAAAREVAKTTTFSAEQAAESFYFLASAGLDANSSIAALPQVAAFAQAGMFDMALATDLLTDAQSALGLTIKGDAAANLKNLTHVGDVLVKVATLANATVEQFSTSLTTKAGPALRALNKPIEEGAAVLAVFADQGIKGERAGTLLAIVLRDLGTKGLENRDAFEALGVAVYDQNDNMRNLGDITKDLEVALDGMSDAQRKATLMQLGFTDKSIAGMEAMIGSSGAMKNYEGALGSAGGMTKEVADKQLKSLNSQFELLKSEVTDVALGIGKSFEPALRKLMSSLKVLVPIIGDKLKEAFEKVDWEELADNATNFISTFVDNIDEIAKAVKWFGILTAGLLAYTTAVKASSAAMIIQQAIIKRGYLLNPWGLLGIAVLGFTALLIKNNGQLEQNIKNTRLLTSQADQLDYTNKNLADSYKEAAWAAEKYGVKTDAVKESELRLLAATENVSGEMGRFGQIKLDTLRNEIRGVKQEIIDTYHSGAAASAVFEGILGKDGKGIDFKIPSAIANSTVNEGSTGSTGPSAYDQAREKIQDLIKSSQKELARAQDGYNKAVLSANKSYTDSVARLQEGLAKKLGEIEEQSRSRLKDVYRGLVSYTVGQFTAAFKAAEDARRSAFEEAKSAAIANNEEFTKAFTEGDPVTAYLEALRAQSAKAAHALELSSKLFTAGFSQTFIEETLAAGDSGGLALAEGLVNATPEAQKAVQDLFAKVQVTASTGIDALAQDIFEAQGLATQELRDLYGATLSETADAMLELEASLADALESASTALFDTIVGIKDAIKEQIAEMGAELGGMTKTIEQFIALLDRLAGAKAAAAIEAATGAGGSMSRGSGSSTPSISIQPIPSNIPKAPIVTTMPRSYYQDSTQARTVVNVNVKTDATQSPAMVGSTLGRLITKYVDGGGSVSRWVG